jgi:chromate transporter
VDVAEKRTRLFELARLFLWLGTIGFGGPAAHLTLMEEEAVRRRRWLSSEDFLDLVGLTNLIPGPNSTEMAMAIGYRRAGWVGLVVAGACFIVPAATITAALAWAYVRFGTLPGVVSLLAGTGPAIVAVMTLGVLRIGRTAVREWPLLALATVIGLLALRGLDPFLLLVAGAATGLVSSWWGPAAALVMGMATAQPALIALARVSLEKSSQAPGLPALAWFFVKTGAVLYGSGYVLIVLLRSLVSPIGWLTERQLLDAVAAGQVTPGPVLSTATFVGFLVSGPAGAIVATIAIFLPAFVFVSLMEPLIGRVGASARARRFMNAVNATAVGLMASATIDLSANVLARPRAWPAVIVAVAIGIAGRSAVWMLLAALAVTLLTNLALL